MLEKAIKELEEKVNENINKRKQAEEHYESMKKISYNIVKENLLINNENSQKQIQRPYERINALERLLNLLSKDYCVVCDKLNEKESEVEKLKIKIKEYLNKID